MPISRPRNSTSAPAPRGSLSGARCCRSKSLKRVQTVYQRRTLSNLRSALQQLVPADEARSLAAMIAAMIDGVWLRAALSGGSEADSESARALLTEFVDGRLQGARRRASARRTRRRAAQPRRARGRRALRVHQSRHRRGAGLCRASPARRRSMPRCARAQAAQRQVGGDDGRGARARAAARRRSCCARATRSSPSSRRAIPASRSRRLASSTCSRAPTASSISPASRQP